MIDYKNFKVNKTSRELQKLPIIIFVIGAVKLLPVFFNSWLTKVFAPDVRVALIFWLIALLCFNPNLTVKKDQHKAILLSIVAAFWGFTPIYHFLMPDLLPGDGVLFAVIAWIIYRDSRKS